MTNRHRVSYTNKSRAWLFTINNPLATDKPMFNANRMNYLIFQLEEGQNGTPHYQGYVYFKNEVTSRTCHRHISARASCFVARGTPQENKAYCSKPEGRIQATCEYGQLPRKRQGNRTDLLQVKKMIDDGKSTLQVAKSHFGSWCRYNKSFNQYRLMVQGKRRTKTKVIVIYGSTGIGKSTFAHDKLPKAWCKGPGTKWFDSYCGEDDVIFDDMNVPWMKHDMLKRIMDKFPLMVESKGGYIQFTAKRLIITTNVHPQLWFRKLCERRPNAWLELKRRIDLLVHKTSTDFVIEEDNGTCDDELEWFQSSSVDSTPPVVGPMIAVSGLNDHRLLRERLIADLDDQLDSDLNQVNMDELSLDLNDINMK